MTVASIQQRYGALALAKGRPLRVGAAAMVPPPKRGYGVPNIPTGFAALDEALGIGGLAIGRVSEILGPATSGKTTLALKFLAQAQANEGQVGYVDYAHAFDPDYAHRCGLDLSRLLVATPYDLTEALVTLEALTTSDALSALVFDAPDMLCSDDMDTNLPRQAGTNGLAACLDRIVAPLARVGTVLLFLRAPVARVDPGLSALAHHATVRLYITRERWLRPAQVIPSTPPTPPNSRGAVAERDEVPVAGHSASLRSPALATAGRSTSLRSQHNDIRGYEGRVEILKNRLGPAGRVVNITIRFNGTVRGEGL